MPLSADEIAQRLHLVRHPTCGFVAETYRSQSIVPAASLGSAYGSDRPLGSALYFMVTPDTHIVMHRIRSDQQYHHYLGDPLELVMLLPDGSGQVVTVGNDLAAGMQPQLFIPGGTFHMARLKPGGTLALLGSTEWPGVEPPDVELGDRDHLVAGFPKWQVEIDSFIAGDKHAG